MKRITVNLQESCHHTLSVFAAYNKKSINDTVIAAVRAYIRSHSSYKLIAKDLLQCPLPDDYDS